MSSLASSVSASGSGSASDDTGIVRINTFDIKNIQFGAPKLNQSGGKNVSLYNVKAKKGLTLQTPLMLTWGVNEWTDEKSGRKSYDMALQFPNEEYVTQNTTQFLENMKALEEHIKTMAVQNSKDWFNKTKMSPEVVDALWTPMLRFSKNKETGEPDYTKQPSLKVKLPYYDNKFEFELYDNQGSPIFNAHLQESNPIELIPKASNVAIVIQCGGIWFANGKFGITWRLVQGLVKPRANLKGRCHIQLDDAEQTTLSQQVVADEEAVVDVPDSDEEDGPAAEPEPVAAPTKKVKKVVKKKA